MTALPGDTAGRRPRGSEKGKYNVAVAPGREKLRSLWPQDCCYRERTSCRSSRGPREQAGAGRDPDHSWAHHGPIQTPRKASLFWDCHSWVSVSGPRAHGVSGLPGIHSCSEGQMQGTQGSQASFHPPILVLFPSGGQHFWNELCPRLRDAPHLSLTPPPPPG